MRATLRRGPVPALLGLVLLVLVIRPWGAFWLDDDWTAWLTVRRLLGGGGLVIPDIVSPTLVWHALWGAGFAKVFGASPAALRLSTLVLAAAALAALAALAREREDKAVWTLAPSLLLLACPLFLIQSLTFMTDVPFLAWSLLSLLALRRAARTGATGWWLAAGLLAAAAYLVRQLGLPLTLGGACWLWSRRKLKPRAAWYLGTPLAAALLHGLWFHFVHGPTWASSVYVGAATAARLSHPWALLWDTYYRAAAAALYLSLFTLPLLAALVEREGLPARGWKGGALALAALLPLVCRAGRLPYFTGIIGPGGLGVPTISGLAEKASGLIGSPAFFWALTAAGAAGVLGWACHARLLAAALRDEDASLLAWPAALCLAASMLGARFFDRYFLAAAPAALLLAFRAARPARATFAASLLSALLLAWSGLGAADYFAWNAAKTQAGALAAAAGIPADRLLNGLDWIGPRVYEERMAALKAQKPLSQIGEWEWLGGAALEGATSFSAVPQPGFETVASASYRTPLSLSPARVYVHRQLRR